MRPNEWLLAVGSEGGKVSLVAKRDGVKINLVGASIPTSASSGTNYLNSLTVAPETDKEGIIAVELDKISGSGKSRETTAVRFFLHVKNVAGKAEINLTDEWFPFADKLGHIVSNHIEVNINGEWYTTEECYDPNYKYENSRETGKSFVLNGGNLLCKYLAGDVDARTVIDAAEKAVEEKNALVELAELKKELIDARNEILKTTKALLKVIEDRNNGSKRHTELLKEHITAIEVRYKEINFLEKSREELDRIAHRLNDSSIFVLMRRNKMFVTNNIVKAYNG